MAAAKVHPQRSDRSTMLNGSAIMLVAMMLVNLFNFAYNMVMARMLGPGAFGNINAAVTLLLLASCIGRHVVDETQFFIDLGLLFIAALG